MQDDRHDAIRDRMDSAATRRGETISALPDWVSLAVGAVLLVIAVFSAFHNLGLPGIAEWMLNNWGRALAIPALILCVCLYLLKVEYVQIYGMIELFVAAIVLTGFISEQSRNDPIYDSAFVVTFVAGFIAPVYIGVRGLENVGKWLKLKQEASGPALPGG